ncbi:hypothetical protein D9M71_807110 [compost metagenome]
MSVAAFQARLTVVAVFEGEARPPGALGGVVSLLAALTVTLTVADEVTALLLSVATALKVWVPADALLQLTL